MRKRLTTILLLGLLGASGSAAGLNRAERMALADTLSARAGKHFGVSSHLTITRINDQRIQFGRTLSDYPWREDDLAWFQQEIAAEWRRYSRKEAPKALFCKSIPLAEYIMPAIGRDGQAGPYADRRTGRRSYTVRQSDAPTYKLGLSGRHIALWHSHGYCYYEEEDRWNWQRAPVHRTVEDLFTKDFVLTYLIPMLENAGAYVLCPHERDTQTGEVICDNDRSFAGPRSPQMRRSGRYRETGNWEDAGEGFADQKAAYEITDNPFRMGSARKVRCSREAKARARWSPQLEEAGKYAIYVSYKSLAESCRNARYTVHHRGGRSSFDIDQQRGGGTWIYLGSFELDGQSYVELDNRGKSSEVVSADAVKFGGGFGKIRRGGRISGMPSWAEGASYWLPWAGVDSSLRDKEKSDYVNDFAIRADWVAMMKNEKGIPIDCSLAFHTDAGTAPADSTIGTLAIYSLFDEQTRKFSDGSDRMVSRLLADYVQTQIVEDTRQSFEPKWVRRELWDRAYREVRSNDTPAMLLELLSHQNLTDMTYGQDPAFRFMVCRAVYKGILKFLSTLYGCSYQVQPLPVRDFSVRFSDDASQAVLHWRPTPDPLEPTASPQAYLVRTRRDGGPFDAGIRVEKPCLTFPLEKGHIYSFQVSAINDGGSSFPSEILSIGRPAEAEQGNVLIVNNFDRISAPTWKEGDGFGGFAGLIDSGVPYLADHGYIGENYEFRRDLEWKSDDDPGFGASHRHYAGTLCAGNSFDYPYIHGKTLLALGYGFCSMSRGAFCADSTATEPLLDLICGKQLTVKRGTGEKEDRHAVFPPSLRKALSRWTERGGHIFLSGNNIASDAWIRIFPIEEKPEEAVRDFVKQVLGYRFDTAYGTAEARLEGYAFLTEPNPVCYHIEAADAISPAHPDARCWMRYPDSGKCGAVLFQGNGYRSAAVGVPLECFREEADRKEILAAALAFLTAP